MNWVKVFLTIAVLSVFSFGQSSNIYDKYKNDPLYDRGVDIGTPNDALGKIHVLKIGDKKVVVNYDTATASVFVFKYHGDAKFCDTDHKIEMLKDTMTYSGFLDTYYFHYTKNTSRLDTANVAYNSNKDNYTKSVPFASNEWVEMEIPCELVNYTGKLGFIGVGYQENATSSNYPVFDQAVELTNFGSIPKIPLEPVLTIPTIPNNVEDSVLFIQLQAIDPDSDKLELNVDIVDNANKSNALLQLDTLTNANGSSSWRLRVTTTKDYFGVDTLVFTLKDNKSTPVVYTRVITTLPVNDKPTVKNLNGLTVKEGKKDSIDLGALLTAKGIVFGPANESTQKIKTITLLSTIPTQFNELRVNDKKLIYGVKSGALNSSFNFNFTMRDDGGVAYGGNDSASFILPFNIVNDSQTIIEIDTIFTPDDTIIVIGTNSSDTIYINDSTVTIKVEFGEIDSAVVVNNIVRDTIVTIVARDTAAQYPDTAQVVIIFNTDKPVIKLMPLETADSATFVLNSKWLLHSGDTVGTVTMVNGSIENIWTNYRALKVERKVQKRDKNKNLVTTIDTIAVNDIKKLTLGKNDSMCVSEEDVFGNITKQCMTIFFNDVKPKVEFIFPESDDIEFQTSYIDVDYRGIYNLYDDAVPVPDTTKVDGGKKVFDGEGRKTIDVSFMDPYGNRGKATRTVVIAVRDPSADVAVDYEVVKVEKFTWAGVNPTRESQRFYVVDQVTQSKVDHGGTNYPSANGGAVQSGKVMPYSDVGFGLTISLELPTLEVMADNSLNWNHTVTVSCYVYDFLGQYITHYTQSILIDNPNYIDTKGKVVIKAQMLPVDGYMVDKSGRAIGSGVYLLMGKVKTVSTPNTNYFKEISARSSVKLINERQGYYRD